MSIHLEAKIPLLLIGGGGHCQAVIDVIEQNDHFQIVGIVEAAGSKLREVMGYPVIGFDKDLPELIKQTPHCLITVGQLNSSELRRKLFERVLQLGGVLPAIYSPLAYVSKHAKIGQGSVIMHHALINNGAVIGENCIVNSKSLVEHNVQIGNHCHLSTATVLNGDVVVGDDGFIGSGSVIKNGVTIGNQVVVGAASYVNQNIQRAGIYIGSPVKPKT